MIICPSKKYPLFPPAVPEGKVGCVVPIFYFLFTFDHKEQCFTWLYKFNLANNAFEFLKAKLRSLFKSDFIQTTKSIVLIVFIKKKFIKEKKIQIKAFTKFFG